MTNNNENEEKTLEASQHKLEKAKEKGQIPRSQDLNFAFSFGGLVSGIWLLGSWMVENVGVHFKEFIRNIGNSSQSDHIHHAWAETGHLFYEIAPYLAAWLFIPTLFVVLSIALQRSFLFTGDKIKPKLSRVSLAENAKNKFGRSGLFEFAKNGSKMLLFTSIFATYLIIIFPNIISFSSLEGRRASIQLLSELDKIMHIILIVSIIFGGIDYFWKISEHRRINRMSHKEMRDELKGLEGDPFIKQARRQKAEELAFFNSVQNVKEADVVIVNPTHFAVALKWSRDPGSAPNCIAKGTDEIAARMREMAGQHCVPIFSDPPTARAIFATVEIGQEIQPAMYAAVATAIRFADNIQNKKTWS